MSKIDITISYGDDGIFPLQVNADDTVESVKRTLADVIAVSIAQQRISFQGRELANHVRLTAAGVRNDDLLMLTRVATSTARSAPGGGASTSMPDLDALIRSGAAAFRAGLISHPTLMDLISAQNPALAQAVLNASTPQALATLQNMLNQLIEAQQRRTEQLRREQALMQADIFDVDAQRQIEEEIRLGNVNENMELAMDLIPESFGRVVMLYVPAEVGGVYCPAFVDSGAQSTIMSAKQAQKCGIMRLLDTRFAGIAKGVGTSRILGKIHRAPLKLGNTMLECSFTILENDDMPFLFGLDMLRRHQACIDLKRDGLVIGDEVIRFLAEKDLAPELRDEADEPEVASSPAVPSLPAVPAPVPARNPATNSSTSSAPATNAPVRSAASAAPAFNEADINMLCQMGFSRPQVVEALTLASGNVEMAASYLHFG